jgi:hypothetical protein
MANIFHTALVCTGGVAHRDGRLWVALFFWLAAITMYFMSGDLALHFVR